MSVNTYYNQLKIAAPFPNPQDRNLEENTSQSEMNKFVRLLQLFLDKQETRNPNISEEIKDFETALKDLVTKLRAKHPQLAMSLKTYLK